MWRPHRDSLPNSLAGFLQKPLLAVRLKAVVGRRQPQTWCHNAGKTRILPASYRRREGKSVQLGLPQVEAEMAVLLHWPANGHTADRSSFPAHLPSGMWDMCDWRATRKPVRGSSRMWLLEQSI